MKTLPQQSPSVRYRIVRQHSIFSISSCCTYDAVGIALDGTVSNRMSFNQCRHFLHIPGSRQPVLSLMKRLCNFGATMNFSPEPTNNSSSLSFFDQAVAVAAASVRSSHTSRPVFLGLRTCDWLQLLLVWTAMHGFHHYLLYKIATFLSASSSARVVMLADWNTTPSLSTDQGGQHLTRLRSNSCVKGFTGG